MKLKNYSYSKCYPDFPGLYKIIMRFHENLCAVINNPLPDFKYLKYIYLFNFNIMIRKNF
jgi:hypothetical protein